MAKCVLNTTEKVVGGLALDDFAVSLAGVRQHDAKEVGLAALAVGADDRCAFAEIDLGFIARPAFQAAERQLASWC